MVAQATFPSPPSAAPKANPLHQAQPFARLAHQPQLGAAIPRGRVPGDGGWPDEIVCLPAGALDVAAMVEAWRAIREKPSGAGYRLLRKNCARVAMRVLKAGDASGRVASAMKWRLTTMTPAFARRKVAGLATKLAADGGADDRADDAG